MWFIMFAGVYIIQHIMFNSGICHEYLQKYRHLLLDHVVTAGGQINSACIWVSQQLQFSQPRMNTVKITKTLLFLLQFDNMESQYILRTNNHIISFHEIMMSVYYNCLMISPGKTLFRKCDGLWLHSLSQGPSQSSLI